MRTWLYSRWRAVRAMWCHLRAIPLSEWLEHFDGAARTFWGRFYSVSMVLVMLLVGVMLMPSAWFLRPESMTVEDRRATIVFATPLFDEVEARWTGEVMLVDRDGYRCIGGGRADDIFHVEGAEADVVTFGLRGWADDCIEAGPPYVVRYRFQVLLLGIIPLRPAHITSRVNV